MSDSSDSWSTIPSSVPDKDVPAERVETATARKQRQRRDQRFLKGPISFRWIRENIQYPADRLLLVLRAHTDMQRSNEIKITKGILVDAGISDRQVVYRAIKKLEKNGSLKAIRAPGKKPVVMLTCMHTAKLSS